jgi:flagellar hook-associated protein 3 FlgL
MRVSTIQIAESSLLGVTEAFSRFDDAQRRVNTGKQVQKPSDDPSGVAQSLNFRERLSEIDQFGRTMDQAKGFLATSESALASVSALLRQARTIAVQGGSDNNSQETFQALAGQIQNIITQIGNIGNTSYGSRYVFAGQRTNAPPFVGAGGSFNYVGGTALTGDGDVILDIGRGEAMTVNVTGDTSLSPALAALTQLRDDLAMGQSALISQNDIAALDTQINNILSVRADMGAKVQRIDLTKQRNEMTKVNFTQFISNIEDADMPKAVVEMQTAQTAYQAALASTARAFSTSLLDFLK